MCSLLTSAERDSVSERMPPHHPVPITATSICMAILPACVSPSPRISRGEGRGEGQTLAPATVAAPHPNPLPILKKNGERDSIPQQSLHVAAADGSDGGLTQTGAAHVPHRVEVGHVEGVVGAHQDLVGTVEAHEILQLVGGEHHGV